MKTNLIILLTFAALFSKAQKMVVDLRETNLYRNPNACELPKPVDLIKPLPVNTELRVIEKDRFDCYYKVIAGLDTGFILRHTLIDSGSIIKPINIEILYNDLFRMHRDLQPIMQYQKMNQIDHRNYARRLRINNEIYDTIRIIINQKKLRMLDYAEARSRQEEFEEKIDKIISDAYADAKVQFEQKSKSIWNRYAEIPKFKFFPSRNAATSMMFYRQSRQITYLSNVNIEGWDSLGSIKSAVFTGYLWPIQFSINTMISRITPQRISESQQRMLDSIALIQQLNKIDSANSVKSTLYKTVGGGGEISLAFKYPLIAYNIAKSLDEFSGILEISNYTGFDLPLAGRFIEQKDLIINNVFQIQPSFLLPFRVFDVNGHGVKNTSENFSGIFLKTSYNLVNGSARFYDALHIKPEPFGYYSISFGLTVSALTIQYTYMRFVQTQLDNSRYNRLQVLINTTAILKNR